MWKISIIREKNIEANEKNMKMWYPVATTALTLVKILLRLYISSVQFSHLGHVWLCDPINHSTPGLPVHHQLPEFTQTHVHWVGDAISFSVVLFSSCLQSFPSSGSFQMSQFFTSGGPSIGVSASASVLPMNIQDWFPLGWTGWISMQFKGYTPTQNCC